MGSWLPVRFNGPCVTVQVNGHCLLEFAGPTCAGIQRCQAQCVNQAQRVHRILGERRGGRIRCDCSRLSDAILTRRMTDHQEFDVAEIEAAESAFLRVCRASVGQ